MFFVWSEHALAIFVAHGFEPFIRSIYRKVEQISDERPPWRSRGERHAPIPDKTSNEVQCQTSKGHIKDVEPHDRNPMEQFCGGTNSDMFMQLEQALYPTTLTLKRLMIQSTRRDGVSARASD